VPAARWGERSVVWFCTKVFAPSGGDLVLRVATNVVLRVVWFCKKVFAPS